MKVAKAGGGDGQRHGRGGSVLGGQSPCPKARGEATVPHQEGQGILVGGSTP